MTKLFKMSCILDAARIRVFKCTEVILPSSWKQGSAESRCPLRATVKACGSGGERDGISLESKTVKNIRAGE